MATRSKRRGQTFALPPPSPALARRTAERQAKKAAEKAEQDDDRTEVARLREQLATLSTELGTARARILELEAEVQSAADAEEAVRGLLTRAYDDIAELEAGNDAAKTADDNIGDDTVNEDDNDDEDEAPPLDYGALTGSSAAKAAFNANPGDTLTQKAEAAGAAAMALSATEMERAGIGLPNRFLIAGNDGLWHGVVPVEKVDAHAWRVRPLDASPGEATEPVYVMGDSLRAFDESLLGKQFKLHRLV